MIKLFTHTDLDGVGCAILAKLAFGEDVDIEYCNYDEINSKVEEYSDSDAEYECHITDISINEELAEKINNSGKKYLLFDHHPTALGLNKYEWCKVSTDILSYAEEKEIKTSGTELYYNWMILNGYLLDVDDAVGDTLDRFVNLVRNYDTWRWATLGKEGIICKQINDLFYLYGRDKFIDWCISEINDGAFPKLHEADRLVLEIKQKEIDDYVEAKSKQLFIGNLCGRVCGFVFADRYVSELGNRLCQMYPEFDFVAMINMDGTVSYRAVKDDIDLGKDVAKVFGGGGHPKAAGSQFSKEVQMEVIKKIFE